MIGSDGFHIGDKVVYPNHGVGIIEQISSRTIGASVEKFYLLKIKASSLKVMVPFNNVNSVGLRRVVRNVRYVLAIELMCAAQGLDCRAPLRAGRGAARGLALVRELVAPLTGDRVLAGDIARLADAIDAGHFAPAFGSVA